jgi:hypothetical protein
MIVDHFLVPSMLILHMLIPLLLLCLLRLHSCLSILLMIQMSLVLRVLDHGYLNNILVIPAKDQVDIGVEMRMKMMISSRNFQMNSLSPLLLMDDKGGDEFEIKISFSVSALANPEVSGFQIRQFRIWVWYATCCVIIHFSSYGYENNL